MSWDLSAFQTKSPVTSIDDLTEDDLVPLQRQQIMTELAVIAKACDAQLDTNDPTWLIMQTDAWIVEFGLGKREPLITMGLHVRGDKEPKEVFAYLVHECGMRLLEWSTGEFLTYRSKAAFESGNNGANGHFPKIRPTGAAVMVVKKSAIAIAV